MQHEHQDKPCGQCGDAHDPADCWRMTKCEACGHAHNHRGCTDCDCKICPVCKHVHGGGPEPTKQA